MLTSESKVTSPFTNTIRFKLCLDFESKSEFAAAYVSRSLDTYAICAGLVEAIPRLGSNLHGAGVVSGGHILDTDKVMSTNLVFTKVIYLYCDDDIPVEQAGDLVRIYRSNNFTLQLRDGRYASMRRIVENK